MSKEVETYFSLRIGGEREKKKVKARVLTEEEAKKEIWGEM